MTRFYLPSAVLFVIDSEYPEPKILIYPKKKEKFPLSKKRDYSIKFEELKRAIYFISVTLVNEDEYQRIPQAGLRRTTPSTLGALVKTPVMGQNCPCLNCSVVKGAICAMQCSV